MLVATLRETRRGTFVDRHRVHATTTGSWAVGTLVLVEGALTRDAQRRRHIVQAFRVTVLEEPALPGPLATSPQEPERTHASPVTHQRVGHFRRVGIGTPRERLVWVRATTVRAGEPTRTQERVP